MSSCKIECRELSLNYSGGPAVIEGLNLQVGTGEFLCLLGPSGCGKSSLLHLMGGFLSVSGGRMEMNGKEILEPGPERGMVFQKHSLFPWKTALENVMIGPRMRGLPRRKARRVAEEYLNLVGLRGQCSKFPRQMSLGMQQRVGIARAFANHPEVLLMDEPFASLDAQTRFQMQDLLLQIWSRERNTVVFATHDIDEALLLADRIVVLSTQPATIREEIRIEGARPRARRLDLQARKIEIFNLLTSEVKSL